MDHQYHLYDYTNKYIGPATPEQVKASFNKRNGHFEYILIDGDGRVLDSFKWDASQVDVRKVFVDPDLREG